MQKKSNLLRLFLFHPEIFIAIIFSAILYLLTRIDYSLTSLNYSFCIASLWYFIFPKYLKNSTKTDLVIKGILILFLSGTFIFSEIVPIILSYILNKISKSPYAVFDSVLPLILSFLLVFFSVYILINNKNFSQYLKESTNSNLRVFISLWFFLNCTFILRAANLHSIYLSIKEL